MKRIPATLRQRVAEAARFRCGYCLIPQRIIGPLLEIDHIIPQAQGGTNDEDNLFLACPMCNSHKADRLEAVDPESAATVPLFNPRTEQWDDHLVDRGWHSHSWKDAEGSGNRRCAEHKPS